MATSRSRILLEKEYKSISESPITGINVTLQDWNIYCWSVYIYGPSNTPWQDGIYELELRFDENYNIFPPAIRFMTIPFHPNIDMQSGTLALPCLEITNWEPKTTISDLLSKIQILLNEPLLDSPVNTMAAMMFLQSKPIYDQITADCALQSIRAFELKPQINFNDIVQSWDPQPTVDPIKQELKPLKETSPASVAAVSAAISYHDYYKEWLRKATTKDINSDHESKIPDVNALKKSIVRSLRLLQMPRRRGEKRSHSVAEIRNSNEQVRKPSTSVQVQGESISQSNTNFNNGQVPTDLPITSQLPELQIDPKQSQMRPNSSKLSLPHGSNKVSVEFSKTSNSGRQSAKSNRSTNHGEDKTSKSSYSIKLDSNRSSNLSQSNYKHENSSQKFDQDSQPRMMQSEEELFEQEAEELIEWSSELLIDQE